MDNTITAYSSFLPSQTLTQAEKKEMGGVDTWAYQTMNFYINVANNSINQPYIGYYPFGGNQVSSMFYRKTMYDVYSGEYQFDSMKPLMNPIGGEQWALPTVPKNFNIIKSRVDVLRGEEMNRMFHVSFYGTNEDVVNMKQKHIDSLKVEMEMAKIFKDWNQRFGIPIDEEEIKKTEEELKSYTIGEGKLYIEKLASDVYTYIAEKNDWKRKTNEGFFHLLVTSSEYFKVESFGDEVDFRVVNPLNIFHSIPYNSPFIDDAEWVVERRLMDVSEIVSEFSEYLSEDNIKMLGELSQGNAGNMVGAGLANIGFSGYAAYGSFKLFVYNVEWISKVKVTNVTRKDKKSGMDINFNVIDGEKYTKRKGDKIKVKWVNEVWEGVRIGGLVTATPNPDNSYSGCVYLKTRKRPNQMRSIDNMANVKLSYTGVYTMIPNTFSQSLVGYGMIYQELTNAIWFRIERLIAQSKGKIIGIDTAMIDTTKTSLKDVMYYLQSDGVYFYNSMQPFQAHGQSSPANQFPSWDLTLSNTLGQYIQILLSLRAEWEELSGLSKQRLGEVKSTETVGGVERAVSQSNMITEPFFFIHNEIKRRLALLIVEEAKHTWKDGKVASYAVGEIGSKLLKVLPGEMLLVDYGINAGDSAKQRMVMQKLESLVQLAIQSKATSLLDAIDILTADSIAEIKAKLATALQKQEAMMQQQQNQMMQMEQQKLQMAQQMEAQKLQMEGQRMAQDGELDREKMKNDKDIALIKSLLQFRDGLLKARLEVAKIDNIDPSQLQSIESAINETSQKLEQVASFDDLMSDLDSGMDINELMAKHGIDPNQLAMEQQALSREEGMEMEGAPVPPQEMQGAPNQEVPM